jgi:uncharacterized protein YegL
MGTAITVIFDNSGSMDGQKIDEAKAAFKAWLAKTPESYTWSLINFDNGGKLVVPFGHSRDQVATAIQGFTAHTNTPIVRALKIATKQIKERRAKASPYERHLVLLFTDGEENQDPGGDNEVLRVIRKMRAQNIEVVGIGYHGDGDYLAQAATHYYQADDAEALKAGLDKVDEEVDVNGEVNVTPEDLKAMSELPAPTKHAEDDSNAAPDSSMAVAPAPSPSPRRSHSKGPPPIIIGAIALAILISAFRKSNRRR